jgi:formate dehydrogenase iron-sulfur subunit
MAQTRRASRDATVSWHRSARVLTELLGRHLLMRQVLLLGTGVMLPLAMLAGGSVSLCFTVSVVLTFASQLIERRTFFTAAAGSRLPGS